MEKISSVSLDLDNKWSYMKTHGDKGWETFPSYLDTVVPRVLDILSQRGLQITFFIVGQDAQLEKNHNALRMISERGHEIGNHSFNHEPWLHLYSRDELNEEIGRAEDYIETVTGFKPIGFRGPGFSFSETTLEVLKSRGYEYDASTFPTFLGPLARAYYFMTARMEKDDMEQRKELFGKFSEGFRSLKPYSWKLNNGELTEIPVTTLPLFKIPFHVSYIIYLSTFSRSLALTYFDLSLRFCRLNGIQPSILFHPLDFLGRDDEADLSFFPGMNMRSVDKLKLIDKIFDLISNHYSIVTMQKHAQLINRPVQGNVRAVTTLNRFE